MQPAKLGARGALSAATALIGILVLALPSRAQTVESSQQTNQRIRALSAATRATPPQDYVIGIGDLLAVDVFDVPELSREVRVSQTGTIGIPLVPVRLHVSGLTELQTAAKISEVLQANGLVSHPEVTVNVKEKKSKPITIVGAVAHPMVYQADRQVTLIEVLAEAGGIANDASDTVIISRLSHDATPDPTDPPAIGPEDPAASGRAANAAAAVSGKSTNPSPAAKPDSAAAASSSLPAQADPPEIDPVPGANLITINLGEILETGNTSSNVVLQPGDVVTVPHAGIVYALGAVSKPGGFVVSNDRGQLTTLKLLSLAGGLDRTAKSSRAVIVRKDVGGQQRHLEVDLKKIMKFQAEDVRLQPSDILYVPKSGAKEALIRAAQLSAAIGTAVVIYRLIP
jgi:polysaccharide biosynthesis/export protein